MKNSQLYISLEDWGNWRRRDKNASHLGYHSPKLGEVKINSVSEDEMCDIQEAFDKLKIIHRHLAATLHYRFVKQLPTSKACQKLKIKKSNYHDCIDKGYMFILGNILS